MSHQRQLLFDSSVRALAALRLRNQGAWSPPPSYTPARSVSLTPESAPTAHVIELGPDQTTGPVQLGFEFELFGVRYTWFELSADGFMTFGPHPSAYHRDTTVRGRFIPVYPELNNFIALGLPEPLPAGRLLVAYEVRGGPARRRLVLILGDVQLVLHERTGMIDIRAAA